MWLANAKAVILCFTLKFLLLLKCTFTLKSSIKYGRSLSGSDLTGWQTGRTGRVEEEKVDVDITVVVEEVPVETAVVVHVEETRAAVKVIAGVGLGE